MRMHDHKNGYSNMKIKCSERQKCAGLLKLKGIWLGAWAIGLWVFGFRFWLSVGGTIGTVKTMGVLVCLLAQEKNLRLRL